MHLSLSLLFSLAQAAQESSQFCRGVGDNLVTTTPGSSNHNLKHTLQRNESG